MPTPILSKLLSIGVFLLAIGLLALGAHTLIVPDFASKGYGVPLNGDGPTYLVATGMRDLVLGLVTLALLLRHRSALPLFLGCLTLLPLADVAIVLRYGSSISAIAPHAFGTVVLIVLTVLAIKERA